MYDVIVVGAGAAGSALAARLSENPERSVLLIEAGPVPTTEADYPSDILNAGSLPGAEPDHPWTRTFLSRLTESRSWNVVRGQGLGGSQAVNGTYFIRAHRRDFDDWAAACGQQPQASPWGFAHALPVLKALEADADYSSKEAHGASGPVPVRRLWHRQPDQGSTGPLDAALVSAARDLGFPDELDKNGSDEQQSTAASPGVGPLPLNIEAGLRRGAGLQYVLPAMGRPNLTVRGGTRALRVRVGGSRVTGPRATGVDVAAQGAVETLSAGEVVLAAGALATPQLLMLSGVGEAAHLQQHCIPVVSGLPGVGQRLADHPDITLQLRLQEGMSPSEVGSATAPVCFATGLNFSSRQDDGRGDLELLLSARPLSTLGSRRSVICGSEDYRTFLLMLGLQRTESRGELRLRSNNSGDPPCLHGRFLTESGDAERLRDGLRAIWNLLDSPDFDDHLAAPPQLRGGRPLAAVVDHDQSLDRWARDSIGTRFHTCGGAAMGAEADDRAVTDPYGRVRGVTGLRVADLSVLPSAPSRGPSNTAVFIGELMARFMG